jgi:hypothetical protein
MVVMVKANPIFDGKRGALYCIFAGDSHECRIRREFPQMLGVSHAMTTQSDQSYAYWRHGCVRIVVSPIIILVIGHVPVKCD